MTNKELRILDEMLTNLEIWSTWNKTFANEMIGICSKMRNLLADRKTEPNSSEKPNNCETCANGEGDIEACGYCRHGDLYEPKTEPTISKMEQVDKDINVRSKDEPQTNDLQDWKDQMWAEAIVTEPQTADCPFDDKIPCEWVCTEYGNCKYKPKTEPQTENSTNAEKVQLTDEPQTEREGE